MVDYWHKINTAYQIKRGWNRKKIKEYLAQQDQAFFDDLQKLIRQTASDYRTTNFLLSRKYYNFARSLRKWLAKQKN